ncbi:MAG: DUF3144 domain-containing protein [Candidatus Thiodiazotropha sp.]
MQTVDDEFSKRADAHIHLSNDQISEEAGIGKVSASQMYASARFNAWVSACNCDSGKEMSEAKAETLEYFVNEYSRMLEDNLDEYIANFESYMKMSNNKG